jgi:hypothetical protein
LRRIDFSVLRRIDREKSHSSSTNSQDIGVGLSNLEVLTSCQSSNLARGWFCQRLDLVMVTFLALEKFSSIAKAEGLNRKSHIQHIACGFISLNRKFVSFRTVISARYEQNA